MPGDLVQVALGDLLSESTETRVEEPSEYPLLTVRLNGCGVVPAGKRPNKTRDGRPHFVRRPGQILIGRQNFHRGGAGMVPELGTAHVTSNAISAFDVKPGYDPSYVLHLLQWTETRQRAASRAVGTGQQEISQRELLALPVRVPGLLEQRRIVDLVATATAARDTAVQRENRAREALDALLDAEAARVRLGSGATPLRDVVMTNQSQLRGNEKRSIRYVTLSDVSYRTSIGPELGARGPLSEASSRARRLAEPGDVLLSTVRPALRGSARVVDSTDLVISTGFAVLRVEKKRIHGTYLYGLVTSPRFAQLLAQKAVGSTYPAVTARDVVSVPLDLPPFTEQERRAEHFDALSAYVAACASAAEESGVSRDILLHDLLSGSHRIPASYDDVMGSAR